MKEFDIFVPLFHNDGSPIDAAFLQQLQANLLENFEGLTYFPQPNKGFWKMGDAIFEDEIVIYRVIGKNSRKSRRILSAMKRWMKSAFEQEEILIIERTIHTVD